MLYRSAQRPGAVVGATRQVHQWDESCYPQDSRAGHCISYDQSCLFFNSLMQRLGYMHSIDVPTATGFRKYVATVAASRCSSPEVQLISKQIAHSVETYKSYEMLHGSKYAAEAHKAIEKLVSATP